MKHLNILAVSIFIVTIISCSDSTHKEEPVAEVSTEGYQKCLEDFFSGIPLDNCPSYSHPNSGKRIIKTQIIDGKLNMEIEIPECLNQLSLYHSWIAAETQVACLENKASFYSFTDGESETYFSIDSDTLPKYVVESNRDIYFDRSVSGETYSKLKTILFNNALPSESSYYVYIDDANIIQVCAILHIETGNKEDYRNASDKLLNLKFHFEKTEFDQKVNFNAMEQYGRVVFSL